MGNPKIFLLVDDDEDDRCLFEEALYQNDISIKFFSQDNGMAALEFMKNSDLTPDFIFLDVNMPLINGFDCLRELKKIKRLEKVPTVIYSTANNPHFLEQSKQYGADYYLVKPNSYQDLVLELSYFISGQVSKISGHVLGLTVLAET